MQVRDIKTGRVSGWFGIKTCLDCGVNFESKAWLRRFCDACRDKRCICPECGNKKSIKDKFCGNSCAGKWKYRNNPILKQNLSIGAHSEKRFEVMRNNAGESHHRYKHGLSKAKEYKKIKDEVWKTRNLETFRLNRKKQSVIRRGFYLSKKELQAVYEANIIKYGTLTCELCEEKIIFGDDSLEHKLPLCKGGTNEADNLAIAHVVCNIKKNKKTMEEWEQYKKRTNYSYEKNNSIRG